MSDNGLTQKFEVMTASGASSSSYMDTGGRAFRKMALRYVTMSTGAAVSVYGSDAPDGTFQPVRTRESNAFDPDYNVLNIATAVSGGWGMFDAPPHRYLQFITSAVVSGGVSFTILANG